MLSPESLSAIGNVVTIIIFSIVAAHAISKHHLTSGVLACLAYLAVQCFGLALKPLVFDFISNVDIVLGRLVYYFGLAIAEGSAVYIISSFHRKTQQPFSIACSFIIGVLLTQAVINIIRVIDRQLDFNILQGFYSYMIPSLNIAVVAILLFDFIKTKKTKRS